METAESPKQASTETEESPHQSKSPQSQPQLELGTPSKVATLGHETSQGLSIPQAAVADKADKAYDAEPEESVDLRELAQNLEEYELDYNDVDDAPGLLTADEAYGGAEGYIIAADLAKQAAEAANIADAAQDQALRHLMVARRLSHETDLHTQREAELRSAAQFIDQLTEVGAEIAQEILSSQQRLAEQELGFYQAEQAAAEELRDAHELSLDRYQAQETKLAGIQEEKVAVLMAAADYEGSLAALEATITDNDKLAAWALPRADQLRHQARFLSRDESKQRTAQRFAQEAAAVRSGIESKEAQLARLQDELEKVDQKFHEAQQTVKEVRADKVERGVPKDTSTEDLHKRLQDLKQDMDTFLARASQLAASEEKEGPTEPTSVAVKVTTPDTQEGGRRRSEAEDDVFLPSPQYQQLKGSWHEDLPTEDVSQVSASLMGQ